MGQCPMMITPGHEDDETSIISAQTRNSMWSITNDARDASVSSFLVPHRSDRLMRCILDPHHVDNIIAQQADELAFQARELNRIYLEDEGLFDNMEDDDDDDDVTMTDSVYAPSEAGRTDITTGSVATLVAANFDRYASGAKSKARKYGESRKKTKFRVMEGLRENGRMGSTQSTPSNFDSPSRKSHVNGDYQTNTNLHKLQSSPSRMEVNDHHDEESSMSSRLPPSTTPTAFGILVAPCLGNRVRNDSFRKEEFKNAIHLRMKANLIEFYRDHYLPMFPTSPMPTGMTNHSSPPLIRTVSTSSVSTADKSILDFGEGVPSSPIRLLADNSAFMDLALTGSLGLVDQRRTGGPKPVTPPRQRKSPEHYIVLINRRSGVPIAVCALKSPNGPPVVRIYATKQRTFGQRAAASTATLGLTWTNPFPLYAWAELIMEGEFPQPVRYSMYMSSGSDGRFEKEPSYRASHTTTGSPEIMMVGRTELETDLTGCALVSIKSDATGNEDPYFSLSISKGIDPALLICFTAVVDETTEKTMRLQCEMNTRKELRRSQNKSVTGLRRPAYSERDNNK